MSGLVLSILAAVMALGGLNVDPDVPTSTGSSTGVEVLASTHRIEFPERIVIQLTADAPEDIRSVRIFYRVGDANSQVYAYPKSFDNTGPLSARFDIKTGRGSYIPQGVDIEYYYVFTDSRGHDIESGRFSFPFLDRRYNWNGIEFEDFTLYWHDRSERAVRSVGADVSIRMRRVKQVLGLEDDYNFKAVIINDRAEAARSFPPVSQTSQDVALFGGFAMGNHGALVLAGLNHDGLVHELTHLMVDEALGSRNSRIPAWLNEGIAMYFEPHGHQRESEVRRAYSRGSLIPLRHMASVPGRPDDVRLFYSQSASIVRFMASAFGEDRLSALFSEIGDGKSTDDALVSTYGLSTQQLDGAWRASLSGRTSIFEVADPGSLGTSAIIGGALLATATAATVGWIKKLRQSEPTE